MHMQRPLGLIRRTFSSQLILSMLKASLFDQFPDLVTQLGEIPDPRHVTG